ncbi:MAG: MFS transporter [Oceanicaulis sp.]
MRAYASITVAGFAATAITYGPARMGFGLFLSAFREEFDLGSGTAGLISALGFLGFLAALPAGYILAVRISPRTPVLAGLAAAALGMAVISAAQGPLTLAAGAVLALSSAGLSWAPFNTAVHRALNDQRRPGALSVVSTGTTAGIVAGGLAALALGLTGASWRIVWAGFSLSGAAAALAAGWLLSGVDSGPRAAAGAKRRMVSWRAAPLHFVALAFGAASTIYISFAADGLEQAGGVGDLPANAAAGLLFAIYGAAGLAGLATSRAGRRLGLAVVLRLLFAACAASFALLAFAPGRLEAVLVSAALQGAFVMMISAALAFWSERLYPDLPTMSFTAALLSAAAGAVLGPLGAGYAAQALGYPAVFAGVAVFAGLCALAIPQRPVSIAV